MVLFRISAMIETLWALSSVAPVIEISLWTSLSSWKSPLNFNIFGKDEVTTVCINSCAPSVSPSFKVHGATPANPFVDQLF